MDSNVILDVLAEDPEWFEWSATALAEAADAGVLVVNPLKYAEVSFRFDRIEDLEEALHADVYTREPLPWEAAFLAAKALSDTAGEVEPGVRRFRISTSAPMRRCAAIDSSRAPARYAAYFPTVEVVAPG